MKNKSYEIDKEYFNSLSDKDKIILMKKDYKYFLFFLWKFLNLPEPTKVQYDIADFLQDTNHTRKMIQAYRGIGKTFITGGFVVWLLWNNPNKTFLIVSASSKFSEEIAKFIKKILMNFPLVYHLNPSKTNNNSILSFDVFGRTIFDKSPSIKISGINGQITGSRADYIISDDVEVKKNSMTQTMRDGIVQGIQEFSNIIKPGGTITYLGTPQTEDTIYKNLPNRGYELRIWTARYPKLSKISSYKGNLAQWIVDEVNDNKLLEWKPLNPKQHDEKDLTERELDNGKSSFLLQYMLDTSLTDSERYPLKTSDLIIMNCNDMKAPISLSWGSGRQNELDIGNVGFSGDKWYKPMFIDDVYVDYEGSILAIDPSGRGGDETGYSVIKILHGFVYVLESGGIQGGYSDETLTKLALIAKQYKVNEIVVETNFGDGMFEKLLGGILKRIYPVAIKEQRSTTQKEIRIIDTLEPLMNRHKLIINESIVHNDLKENDTTKQLFHQLTRITKDRGSLKHDDRLDALAIGVKYWIESLSVDEIEASELYKKEMLQKEFDLQQEFLLKINGRQNNRNNFMNN
jgi:hypothetical protein